MLALLGSWYTLPSLPCRHPEFCLLCLQRRGWLEMKASLLVALPSPPLPTLPVFTRNAHLANTLAGDVSQITGSKGKTQNVAWISWWYLF